MRTPTADTAVRRTTLTTVRAGGRVRLDTAASADVHQGSGDRVAPFVVRVIGQGPDELTVALVPTTALLLDGDRVAVDVRIGAGTRLRILEVAGTVAYSGAGRGASYSTRVEVQAGGAVVWDAKPFVLTAGARVARDVAVHLEAGARACLRETIVLGRTGEEPGRMQARTRIYDAVAPVLIEDLNIGADHGLPGILGRAKVLDQVTLVGVRPPDADPSTLHLARPAAVHRRLAHAAHQAALDEVAERWGALALHAARTPRAAVDVPVAPTNLSTKEEPPCMSLTTS